MQGNFLQAPPKNNKWGKKVSVKTGTNKKALSDSWQTIKMHFKPSHNEIMYVCFWHHRIIQQEEKRANYLQMLMVTRGHDNVHDDMNMYVIMHDQCLFIAMINSFHT